MEFTGIIKVTKQAPCLDKSSFLLTPPMKEKVHLRKKWVDEQKLAIILERKDLPEQSTPSIPASRSFHLSQIGTL